MLILREDTEHSLSKLVARDVMRISMIQMKFFVIFHHPNPLRIFEMSISRTVFDMRI